MAVNTMTGSAESCALEGKLTRFSVLERPFYFIVVLWGKKFRNYFLDLCLPTLLARGNIPSLNTQERSKFLICTRPEDWSALQTAPIVELLKGYLDAVYLEIPPCPEGVPGGIHMGTGHRLACELAHAAKAYSFVVMPDCIYSDGTVARFQELALQGIELVIAPSLRSAEEPLFDELERTGVRPHGRDGRAAPITLESRELVRMALASMHSETKTYEWDSPYFHPVPSAAWWRIPNEQGIIVHSLCWPVFLIDYAAVPKHDTSTFDCWTLDGDYLYKNMGNIKRVHLILDSDEMFMTSWSHSSDRPCSLKPEQVLTRPVLEGFVKRWRFSTAFHTGFSDPSKESPLRFDPLNQHLFFYGARWHARPHNAAWECMERRALTTLYSCVAPPRAHRVSAVLPKHHWSRLDHIKFFLVRTSLRRVV